MAVPACHRPFAPLGLGIIHFNRGHMILMIELDFSLVGYGILQQGKLRMRAIKPLYGRSGGPGMNILNNPMTTCAKNRIAQYQIALRIVFIMTGPAAVFEGKILCGFFSKGR